MRRKINIQKVSKTKQISTISSKLHEKKSTHNKFRKKINFTQIKSMYIFNKEKNQHVTGFMNKNQLVFHEQKSARSKFHEQN